MLCKVLTIERSSSESSAVIVYQKQSNEVIVCRKCKRELCNLVTKQIICSTVLETVRKSKQFCIEVNCIRYKATQVMLNAWAMTCGKVLVGLPYNFRIRCLCASLGLRPKFKGVCTKCTSVASESVTLGNELFSYTITSIFLKVI